MLFFSFNRVRSRKRENDRICRVRRAQVILLEECWSELFLLNAVQWCLPLENNPLFNPSDHVAAIPNGKASQVAADIRVLNETLRRFRTISVDPAEFACMKAIVLFRAGNDDVRRAAASRSARGLPPRPGRLSV